MTAKAIRDFICRDIVSNTAAAVQALNTDLWASAADVPDYAYKSLGEIWLLTATPASSDMLDNVVYRFAEGDTTTKEITLYTLPTESVLFENGIMSNRIGYEETVLEIVLRLPPRQANWELITNAELRIRYLLDMGWRRLRHGTRPFVPTTGDKSLTGDIITRFEGYASPPNSAEVHVRYCLAYQRCVPKA